MHSFLSSLCKMQGVISRLDLQANPPLVKPLLAESPGSCVRCCRHFEESENLSALNV